MRKFLLATVFSFGLIFIGAQRVLAVAPGNVTSGLDLWFKASTGTNSTTSGASISSWEDQSTFGTDAAQATGADQPVYVTSSDSGAINYNPALDFDGSTDYMTHDDANLPLSSDPRSIFVVGSPDGVSGTRPIYSYGRSASQLFLGIEASGTSLLLYGTSISATEASALVTGIPFFAHGRILNKVDVSIDVNGKPGTRDTSSAFVTAVNTQDGTIGKDSALTGSTWNGKISEIAVYEGPLSTEETQMIYSYLGLKYGITLAGLSGSTSTELISFTDQSAVTAYGPSDTFGQIYTMTSTITANRLGFPYSTNGSSADGSAEIYICNGAVTANTCVSTAFTSTTGLVLPAQASGTSYVEFAFSSDVTFTSGSSYTVVVKNTHATDTIGFYLGSDTYADGSLTSNNTIFNVDPGSNWETTFTLGYNVSAADISSVIDYIASDGSTVMWDADVSATYNFDIAGIGQDDNSALDQTKSKSQNADGVMILSAATSQDNLDFLVAGNNDGSATFSTTVSPSGYGNLSKVWMAQETGNIGTHTVAFDVADTGFDIPTQTTYYLVTDTDLDASLSDETPILLHDDGTNGDETSSDNIYSLSGIDLDHGELFTITTPYTSFSGTVYSDQGVTNIGTGMTIRLLKNGVDTGLTDDTDASGFYDINIAGSGIVADDIITVFIDGETNDGVTVTRAISESTHANIDIYKDFLIVRSETVTAISNNDLDTSNGGDTDMTTIYSNGGTTTLTQSSNKSFLINSGDTWTPGGTSTINGAFFNYGTTNGSTDAISVSGNFYVDNAATFSHTGTLTFAGGTTRTINQGDDAIGSIVVVSNSSTQGAQLTTNPMNISNGLTVSGKLNLGGLNLTMAGTFSNTGTLMLRGSETITGLTQDIDSGTWQYLGDMDSAADTVTIRDLGATDYFNLTIGTNSAIPSTTDTTEIFQIPSSTVAAGSLTISKGTFDANDFAFSAGSGASVSNATYLLKTGAQSITGNFSLSTAGVVTGSVSTLTISGNFTENIATSVFTANNTSLTIGGTTTVSNGTFHGGTGMIDLNSSLTVSGLTTVFTATSGTMSIATNFAHTSTSFTHNSGTIIFDANANHVITGVATTFYNLTLLDTLDNATDVVLTVPSVITETIEGTLLLDGLDTDDRVNLVAATAASAGTIVFSGSGVYSGNYIDVKDSIATDSSTAETVPINPLNSVNSGNTTNWFGDGVTVEFSVSTAASTDESTADNFVTLFVNGTLSSSSTIDVDVTGGDATGSGTDYTFTDPLTVTIPAGTYDGTSGTAITITIPTLVQDSDDESNETIIFALINAGSNVVIDDADADLTTISTHIYTITDDDAGITVEFSSASASSTNESSANNLPVLLVNGVLASSATIDIDITGGSATGSGTDYTLTDPLTVTIPAGMYDGLIGTALSFTAPTLVQDLIIEGNETIIWTLNNGSGISVGDANVNATTQSMHTYTITDDDTLLVEFTSTTNSATETTASPVMTLTVSGAIITSSVTVEVANAGTGSATSGGTDFSMTSPVTITIPAGDYTTASTVAVTGITVVDDLIIESSETINLTLQNGSGVTIADADGNATTESTNTYTITDNDVLLVEFTDVIQSGAESVTSPTITLTVGGAIITSSVTIEVANLGTGSATSGGTDFTYTSPQMITIPTGDYTTASTVAVTGLTVVNDSIVEANETINFQLQNPSGVTIGDADGSTVSESTDTYVITDNDVLLVEFTTQTPSAAESTASPAWTLTVGGAIITSSVTVEVANAGTGTATSGGTDYAFTSPRTITIPTGDYTTASTISIGGITIVDDVISETGGETIDFILQNSSGVTVGDADGNATSESTAIFTITDNDSPTVTIAELGGSSSISESGTTDTYTIQLNTTPSASVSITLTSDADCTISPVGPLSFTTTTAQTITITAVNDALVEGTHSCTITHTSTSADTDYNAITISDVVATITDNDSATYTRTPATITVLESGTTDSFTVVLDQAPSSNVVFSISIDDTSSATVSTATLTFTSLDWFTPQTITVSPVADLDGINETDTVTIAVVDASSDSIYDDAANQTITVNVTDDDDDDSDGVLNTIEDAGFNGGDGDGDGTLDRFQQHVSGAPNPVTGEYTTLKVVGTCVFIEENDMLDESSLSSQDSAASYPVGLVDFRVDCPSPGDSTTVTLYYTETYTTTSWKYKKFNSNDEEYADISSAVTFGTAMVGLSSVTTVTFMVTDGDPSTDEDGVADASINDPSGPAIVSSSSSGGGGGGGGARWVGCLDPSALNYREVAACRDTLIIPVIAPEIPSILTPGPAVIIPSLSPTVASILNPISVPTSSLLDLIGGGEPNVPPEFSDYVCERYLRTYILPDQYNDPKEVVKLQEFLNQNESEVLVVDGVFDEVDVAAINRFQLKYADQILAPWGILKPTGRVYRTSAAKINILMCAKQKGCPYFNAYMQEGEESLDAVKIQDFINIIFAPTSGYPTAGIPLSTSFGPRTKAGVKEFQTVYKEIVLKPWGLTNATGWWYKTSRHAANKLLGCDEGEIVLDNGLLYGTKP